MQLCMFQSLHVRQTKQFLDIIMEQKIIVFVCFFVTLLMIPPLSTTASAPVKTTSASLIAVPIAESQINLQGILFAVSFLYIKYLFFSWKNEKILSILHYFFVLPLTFRSCFAYNARKLESFACSINYRFRNNGRVAQYQNSLNKKALIVEVSESQHIRN